MMTMDWSNIVVAIIALIGTFIGSYSGIRLMSYRIEQLEKKVDLHNQVIERTYKLERRMDVADERDKEQDRRINALEAE